MLPLLEAIVLISFQLRAYPRGFALRVVRARETLLEEKELPQIVFPDVPQLIHVPLWCGMGSLWAT